MKKIALISLIHIFGIAGLFVFIIARIDGGHKILTHRNIPHYGDLYKENYINYFNAFVTKNRILYPRFYRTDKQSNIQKADLLIYGDSFFFFEAHKNFPERVADTLNIKVYFESLNKYKLRNTVYQSFINNDFDSGAARVLLLETGERGIPLRFSKPLDTMPSKITDDKPVFQILESGEANKRYRRILQTSFLTHVLYSVVSTIQFDWFNYIPEYTSRYRIDSIDTPWLFNNLILIDEKATYFEGSISRDDIANYCRNIELLKNDLKEKYNMDLLLISVPEKITIYDTILGLNAYSNFLPKFYSCLDSMKIDYIDIYHPFSKADTVLYHPTDTHWDEEGIKLTMDLFLDYIKKNEKYSHLLKNYYSK